MGRVSEWRDELIAFAVNRANAPWGMGIVLKYQADFLDYLRQGGIGYKISAPYLLEQLLFGDHPIMFLNQVEQYLERSWP